MSLGYGYVQTSTLTDVEVLQAVSTTTTIIPTRIWIG